MSELRLRRQRARVIAGAAIFAPLAFALSLSFAITPEDIESGRAWFTPTCMFLRVFGHPCPTCGMTRAFSALSHGRLDDALRYNRGAPALYTLWWIGAAAAASVALRSTLKQERS
jgi:hypothetical protein